ncbi:hypothetical protein PSENEW3n2_00005400 [Picochlorum sp. SENEW3]|nr:hypothetical protein PSENEW3n2_00005400 [Picochlorum sp. SENEW3]WPT17396.1 hypothetical protein PSENEW3_00005400 [Picochlorum sp. SENEW3]
MKKINKGIPVTVFAGSMGNHQTSMMDSIVQENREINARMVEEDGESRWYPEGDRGQQPMTEGGVSLLHFHLDGVESTGCGCNEEVEDDDWCDNDACGNFSTIKEKIKECLEPRSMYHVRLKRDVRQLTQNITGNSDQLDAAHMGAALTSIGYSVCLRSAIGGGDGVACFTHLSNEFLILDCDEEQEHYIVEPNFREHFAIPHPTKRYSRLLDTVPKELVLPLFQVKPLVTLLYQEMSRSFAMKNMPLPPWRKQYSLLSKWLPHKAHDFYIVLPGGLPSNEASPMPCSPPGLRNVSSNTAFMSAGGHEGDIETKNCIKMEGKRLEAGGGEKKQTSLLSKMLAAVQQSGRSKETEKALLHTIDTSYGPHRVRSSEKDGKIQQISKSPSPTREHRPIKNKDAWFWKGMHPIRIVHPQGIFPRLPPAA